MELSSLGYSITGCHSLDWRSRSPLPPPPISHIRLICHAHNIKELPQILSLGLKRKWWCCSKNNITSNCYSRKTGSTSHVIKDLQHVFISVFCCGIRSTLLLKLNSLSVWGSQINKIWGKREWRQWVIWWDRFEIDTLCKIYPKNHWI